MIRNLIRFTILFVVLFAAEECHGDCDPYSVKACRDAAKALRKSAGGCGYPFESDFSIKGCYTYRGGIYGKCVFYGTGGTEDEMKRHLFSTAIFRPSGYDCSIDDCIPYSVEACKKAANDLGKGIGGGGYAFESSTYSVKGCYGYHSGTYAKYLYYGTGGTYDQKKEVPYMDKSWYRPIGYDCKGDPRECIRQCPSYGCDSYSCGGSNCGCANCVPGCYTPCDDNGRCPV